MPLSPQRFFCSVTSESSGSDVIASESPSTYVRVATCDGQASRANAATRITVVFEMGIGPR